MIDVKKNNKINSKVVKMREFENGREGKKNRTKKKNRREKRNGLEQFGKYKEFKTFFFTNYFPNLMSLTF